MKKRAVLLFAAAMLAAVSTTFNAAAEETTESGTENFQEIAVIDNEKCTVKLIGIDEDNIWGYTINAYLENKTADTTLMYSVDSASVNGVEANVMFATEVAPGKKSNEEINLLDSTLEENGITDFTDIEITFRVFDSNDWSADDVAEKTVHVYPKGEENASVFVRKSQPSDIVLFDNDSASATVTGIGEDDIWGYSVHLYLVNKTTDKTLMFNEENASVNGFMADPYWAVEIKPGKSAFSSMSWSRSAFEENGITSVDDIEFTFRVYDFENWSGEDIYNDTVTLNP